MLGLARQCVRAQWSTSDSAVNETRRRHGCKQQCRRRASASRGPRPTNTLLCLYSALVYTIGKRCTCQKGQLSRFLVSASAAAPGRKAKSRSVSVSEFPLPRSQPPSCVMIQVKPSLEISIGTNVVPREKMAQRSLIGPTAVNSLSFGFWFLADRRGKTEHRSHCYRSQFLVSGFCGHSGGETESRSHCYRSQFLVSGFCGHSDGETESRIRLVTSGFCCVQ